MQCREKNPFVSDIKLLVKLSELFKCNQNENVFPFKLHAPLWNPMFPQPSWQRNTEISICLG